MRHKTSETLEDARGVPITPQSPRLCSIPHCAPVQVPVGPHGVFALVDPDDRDLVAAYRWYELRRRHTSYAIAHGHGLLSMHRVLVRPRRGVEVDHVDGDGLNNRRSNLRFATRSQQMMNRRGWGKSRFVGVCPIGDRWQAYIAKDGRQYNLGHFDTEEEAAIARDTAALNLHGEYARLNFPEVRHGR